MSEKFFPTCPHCNYSFDGYETWHSQYSKASKVNTGDGDESIVVCHNADCKKTFHIICEHVPMFTGAEEDCDE